jgi:4-hydroxy-tetrahydrodipicolinate synthase
MNAGEVPQMSLAGIYPIVPTPLDQSGRIDEGSIARLCAFLAEKGTQGAAILGVMGEAPKLSESEQTEVIRAFRQHLPESLQLVVGVRAGGTEVAVDMAQSALEFAPTALMVGPPPVQNDETIFTYYQRIAEAVDVPIILHDYPESTGILMSPALINRLFSELERVEYIKLEDPPTGLKMEQLAKLTGGKLKVFGALGGMYAFEELDRGAVGIMTGFTYPEFLVEIYRRYQAGDRDGAAELFYDVVALIRFEFQPKLGISLRKHILKRRGVFATTTIRHPGAQADELTLAHLSRIVAHLRARGYDV